MGDIIVQKLLSQVGLFKSLEKIYEKLAENEINNNTREYKENMKYIKDILLVLNKNIGSIRIDDDVYDDVHESIKDMFGLSSEDGILDLFISNRSTYARRLLNQVYYQFKKSDGEEFSSDGEYIADEGLIINISDYYDLLFAHLLMDNLYEYIEETKSDSYHDELTRIKYKLIYLYPELETYFISGKKRFTKTDLLKKCLISNIRQLEDDSYKEIYEEPNLSLIERELEYIASLSEEFYTDDNKHRMYLRALYIKTLLSICECTNEDLKLNKDKDYYERETSSPTSRILIEKIMN